MAWLAARAQARARPDRAQICDGVVGGMSTDLRLQPRMTADLQWCSDVVAANTVEREQGLPNVDLCVVGLCVFIFSVFLLSVFGCVFVFSVFLLSVFVCFYFY